jgi:hypothetical protein
MPYLRNLPGQMLWHDMDSRTNLILSIAGHMTTAGILVALRRSEFRNLAAAGAFIYFMTYIANVILWNDPVVTVGNALYIFRPMLMGLSLCLIALLLHFRPQIPVAGIGPIISGALAWGMIWTWSLTSSNDGRPSPLVVERFATAMDTFVPAGSRMAFLWYNNYNGPLLAYYRLKSGSASRHFSTESISKNFGR